MISLLFSVVSIAAGVYVLVKCVELIRQALKGIPIETKDNTVIVCIIVLAILSVTETVLSSSAKVLHAIVY